MITIRPETTADYPAIYTVNKLAFDGRDAEPQLIEAIRQEPGFIPSLSLVAEEAGHIVGHILFSPIHIITADGRLDVLSLAPMAVHPAQQNRGIGSALVQEGLTRSKQLGHAIVIVLGHPTYYPRFGFSATLAAPLVCPFGDCGAAWMALELVPGALQGVRGEVVYPPAFADA